jgi:hypothetical protein
MNPARTQGPSAASGRRAATPHRRDALKRALSHQYKSSAARREVVAPVQCTQPQNCGMTRTGETEMTAAVVATYKDFKTVRNVEDDLLSTGIPNEKIKVDREHRKIRVMVPDATKSEIMEILNRHEPAEIH